MTVLSDVIITNPSANVKKFVFGDNWRAIMLSLSSGLTQIFRFILLFVQRKKSHMYCSPSFFRSVFVGTPLLLHPRMR